MSNNQMNWLSAYTAHIQTRIFVVCVGETGRVYVCVCCLRTYSCRFGGFCGGAVCISNRVNELSKLICVVYNITNTRTQRHARPFTQWVRQHRTQRIVYVFLCICDECECICVLTRTHSHSCSRMSVHISRKRVRYKDIFVAWAHIGFFFFNIIVVYFCLT